MISPENWCTKLRHLLDAASTESDVPLKYKKAFRFLKGEWVNTPAPGGGKPTPPKPPAVRLKPFSGFVLESGDAAGENTKLDGLTGELNRVFHPIPLGVSTGGAATGGAVRGMKVDQELAHIVNKREWPLQVHPYTAKTITELILKKLRPFACQVAVGSLKMRLATSVDIVCVNENDPHGGLVNVQLKTGFERNYTKTDGMFFHAPFHSDPALECIEDTHANRHLLQLCAEHLIIQTAYNNPLDHSVLMVISQNEHKTFVIGQGDMSIVTKIPPLSVFLNLKKRTAQDSLKNELDAVRKRHAIKKIMKRRRRVLSGKIKVKTEK
jgi:hypothetical protein